MSKQTAVEWLIEQMIERKFFAKDTPLSYTTLEHLTNQALAMEKEQIKDAYLKGYLEEIPNPLASHYYKDMAEDYYTETFKSE